MILNSDDDVKVALFECSIAKWNVEEQHQLIGLKRRREAKAMSWNVQRHIGNPLLWPFFGLMIDDVIGDDGTKWDFLLFLSEEYE